VVVVLLPGSCSNLPSAMKSRHYDSYSEPDVNNCCDLRDCSSKKNVSELNKNLSFALCMYLV
jgi:hypothetical protein